MNLSRANINLRLKQWPFEGRYSTPWRFAAVAIAAITVPPTIAVAAFGSAAFDSLGMAAFLAAMPAYFAAGHAGIAIATLVTMVQMHCVH